jgi:short-subunit dehydrogenase
VHELVVVVGAGPRLGRAIAAAFAERAVSVVLIARTEQRLRETVANIAGAGYLAADVTDERALRSAFDSIRERYGDPAVLIHNPSTAFEAPATETPLHVLMDGFRLAAGSLLVAAQQVAPGMRKAGHGTILVTGNAAAITGSTWSAALAAQKAAARNLTMSLAAELGPAGIHVATVTIDGILGRPGFEPERIAARYAELAAIPSGASWQSEVYWPADRHPPR